MSPRRTDKVFEILNARKAMVIIKPVLLAATLILVYGSFLFVPYDVDSSTPLYKSLDRQQQQRLSWVELVARTEEESLYRHDDYVLDSLGITEYTTVRLNEAELQRAKASIENFIKGVYSLNYATTSPEYIHSYLPDNDTEALIMLKRKQLNRLELVRKYKINMNLKNFICLDGLWTNDVISFQEVLGAKVYLIWAKSDVRIGDVHGVADHFFETYKNYHRGDNEIINYFFVQQRNGDYFVADYIEVFDDDETELYPL